MYKATKYGYWLRNYFYMVNTRIEVFSWIECNSHDLNRELEGVENDT